MADQTVIRTIRVRGVPEGLDELTGKLKQLAGAQENVALVSEQSAKRTLSLEAAYKKQTMQLDESARNQARIASATKIADGALREGLITQQQHAERLNLISQRYAAATVQAGKFAGQTGLNRYELLNLSRQMQDVGVSLASGQSPFVVLTQQGSQILDVFQATTGSVRGFFAQAIGWAGRFATSTAGVVTGVTAIGAAALYMANSFSTAQREIDKVLSGVGAASGVTRGGINRIAEGAAGGGLSIGAAREAALSFAATGKIYEQNINAATNVTRELALAMGKDATEAAKLLSDALIDPAKGALELNKSIRFLDADTLNYITSLQSQGRLQEAQNALMLAAIPAIKRQAEQVDLLTRAWNFASGAVTGFIDRTGKAGARTLERVTGIEGGGFTDQERLAGARQTQQALRSTDIRGLDTGAIEAFVDALRKADAEVARLEKRMSSLTEAARFAQLGLDAREFGQSIDGTSVKIKQLEEGLAKIAQYQAGRLNQGLGVDPALERQAELARQMLATSYEQQTAEQGKAKYAAEVALQYGNGNQVLGAQLQQLQLQLGVITARTASEREAAQYALDYANAMALVGNAEQAAAIASQQRVNNTAQLNVEADRVLKNLQEQGELIRAASEEERGRIKAAQEYNKLIERGVDAQKAGAIAAQMQANARAMQDAADAAQSWSARTDDARSAMLRYQEAARNSAVIIKEMSWELRMINGELRAISGTWANFDKGGDNAFSVTGDVYGRGGSQFKSDGYKSTTETLPLQFAKNVYGEGGFNAKTFEPNATGITNLVNTYLAGSNPTIATAGWAEGGGIMGAIEGLLNGQSGPDTLQIVQRLTELLPDDQKAGVIEREIAMLRAQPQNIETLTAIKQLTDSLEQLKGSTDGLKEVMTDVLSPFYSSDPRRTHLGFRAFAGGGIMTPYGELPIKNYAGGGVTSSAQVAVFGEGSVPEAYVPVPSGRIPVTIQQPANSNEKQARPIQVNITVQGNADASTVAALKATAFQQAQAMRRMLG